MWWLAETQALYRVTDRVSTVYVERCHVDRAENAVVVVNKTRTVRIPAAYIGSLLLGPGTRVTSGAIRLLADSGTAVCWVGEHGVRMYAAGLGPARSAHVIERQAYLVSRTRERLDVARRMYGMRFPGEDVSSATMQQLRGREGARIKRVYAEHSTRTGVTWARRTYREGDGGAAGDDINRALSAAHATLYALCHAAIVGVGASPALGFVHTGSALSFVLDIADLYKAEYSIPVAFDEVAAGRSEEKDVRWAMRSRFADGQLLHRAVDDIKSLLLGSEGAASTLPDEDSRLLWDEALGAVAGGVDWSAELGRLRDGGHVVLSGPELPEVEVDW